MHVVHSVTLTTLNSLSFSSQVSTPYSRLRTAFVFLWWPTGFNQGHSYEHGYKASYWSINNLSTLHSWTKWLPLFQQFLTALVPLGRAGCHEFVTIQLRLSSGSVLCRQPRVMQLHECSGHVTPLDINSQSSFTHFSSFTLPPPSVQDDGSYRYNQIQSKHWDKVPDEL